MFRSKPKRNPCKVIVHFDNLEGRKFDRVIVIPDGYSFKVEFARYPCLLNREGQPAQIFDWRGGFEATYEFLYD